jgi:DNA-binding CsgD family transcriptional regulator
MAETQLSPAEVKILELAAAGDTYSKMAAKLGHTGAYINKLAARMLPKLGADNITQAVAMAIRRKIIT